MRCPERTSIDTMPGLVHQGRQSGRDGPPALGISATPLAHFPDSLRYLILLS